RLTLRVDAMDNETREAPVGIDQPSGHEHATLAVRREWAGITRTQTDTLRRPAWSRIAGCRNVLEANIDVVGIPPRDESTARAVSGKCEVAEVMGVGYEDALSWPSSCADAVCSPGLCADLFAVRHERNPCHNRPVWAGGSHLESDASSNGIATGLPGGRGICRCQCHGWKEEGGTPEKVHRFPAAR